ncbi:TadE/TadG family type IV pilus assembly protein [Hyphococcus sp.]|uniref:TadE/TadG family type IV pilus assembly protein n=1 Tax=Hyphococcus sp. TaxID=2038636 RepID=UPI00208D9559|nr:MAG: hypothetical protein DHS20C04_19150 [Marinicaulis sp.]
MLVFNTGIAGKDNRKRAMRGLTPVIKSFAQNRDGNIIFLFAFMATVLFFFAGGAVDYSRWNAVRADMVESMDAASLALAQLSSSDPTLTDAELKDYGRKFFEANFHHENALEPGWNIEFGLDNNALIITCITGNIKTYLLGVAGIHDLDIGKCVEITKKGSGRVELALVLDVTGSMDESIGGKTKIASLKDAVEIMLDVMYGSDATSDNIKIGVVPFNAYVNPGGASSWSNSWADTGAQAYYHGSRFFHVTEAGNVDMNTKVNHFTLFDSTPGASWAGCVETRPYPLDELDVEPGGTLTVAELNAYMDIPAEYQSSTNTYDIRNYDAFDDEPALGLSTSILTDPVNFKWVPSFHPDEPDCNDSDDCDNGDYSESGTTTYGTPWWGYMFDDPDADGSHSSGSIREDNYPNRYFIDDKQYTNYQKGAPFNKYAKTVYYFREVLAGNITNNAFKSFLDRITVETGSNASHGLGNQEYILRNAYVGWWDSATSKYKGKYDLSPSITSSRGPNRNCPKPILPLTNVRDTVETFVDSLDANGNTDSAHGAAWGWRVLSPEAPFTEGIAPGDPDYEKWQKAVVIMTDGENTVGNDNTHWDSDLGAYGYAIESRMGANMTSRSDMRDEIDNKLLRVCHRMKEEGYLIYTIMFGLDSTSTEKVFRSCATLPTAPYFQDAADGDDLEEAFGEIAADLVNLHISK